MRKSAWNLKKTFLPMTLAAALLLQPVTTLAAQIKTTPNASNTPVIVEGESTSQLAVYANIVNNTGADIISANISWGSLVYNYYYNGWNPETLKVESFWKPALSGVSNKITVENRSNVKISAAFAFTPLDAFKTVTGTFSASILALNSATPATANANGTTDSASSILTIGGDISNPTSLDALTYVGDVTITIKNNN